MRVAPLAAAALLCLAPVVAACTDDGNSEAFCDQVGEVAPLADVLQGLDPGDPAGSRRQLDAAVAEFRALEADAPGAIRADVARLREGVELVVDAVKENPDDVTAAREAIAGRTDELAGLAQAGQAVVDYTDEECGVQLEDLGGGSAPIPSTPGTTDAGPGDTGTTEPGG